MCVPAFAELPRSLPVVDSLRFDGDMLLDVNNMFGLLECELKPRKEGSLFHLLAPDSTPSNHPFTRKGGQRSMVKVRWTSSQVQVDGN